MQMVIILMQPGNIFVKGVVPEAFEVMEGVSLLAIVSLWKKQKVTSQLLKKKLRSKGE